LKEVCVQKILETKHAAAPAGRPMPITFHNHTIWVGCWDTKELIALDPVTLAVRERVALPGKPFGLTAYAGALRIVIGLGDEDDRYIFSYVPGKGMDESAKMACPQMTGSHLAVINEQLALVQQTHGRVLWLDAQGATTREAQLPSRCGGIVAHGQTVSMIAADDDFDVLHYATLDLEANPPALELIAEVNAEARGLAYDGEVWWTCLRELNEIVAFRLA
jgi:hypothetical protein